MSKLSTIFGSLFIILSIINIHYYVYGESSNESAELAHNDSNAIKAENPLIKLFNSLASTITHFLAKIKDSVTNLFSQSGSKSLKLVAAVLLGILLSLTPCIYPMIPITVGILQLNQSTTFIRSFMLAAAYTLGISMVFAILGFIAAIGGATFGKIQGSPLTIIPLVMLLIYLGLSMLGLYELYIPRFLQPKVGDFKGGSIIPSFIFGMASGLVASPCLSPGLLLILDYVSSISVGGSLQSYIEGFMLLFAFGIGSSLPLLIIGTISSSTKVLPRAGAWMVEIKKLVGLMLVGMAFYHVSHLTIIPHVVVLLLRAITLAGLSFYYFKDVQPFDSFKLKIFKSAIGSILIGLSVNTVKTIYKEIYRPQINDIKSMWLHDYKTASSQSEKNKKPLFIDLESSICSACKSVDKKVFQHPEIINYLSNNYMPLKINYDTNEVDYKLINEKFGPIRGFPTYLIISPEGKLLKKMGAELGDLSIDQIIKLFNEKLT